MLSFAWTAATSFSTVPLRLSFGLALAASAFSAEEGIRALLAHLFGWYTISGWTSMTILISAIGAALLFCVGILGEYVGRLYEQSKDRPLYLATQKYNMETGHLTTIDRGPLPRSADSSSGTQQMTSAVNRS